MSNLGDILFFLSHIVGSLILITDIIFEILISSFQGKVKWSQFTCQSQLRRRMETVE